LPGHGALRTDQMVVGDDGLAFVDLDGFCASPPARDLGNLVAYLRWKTIRGAARHADVERLANAFSQGYARARELPERASLARFEAASMLKIAVRRYAGLATHEWAFTPALVAAARARAGC
jgi:hypothetical protein